jgi:phytoene desaturase
MKVVIIGAGLGGLSAACHVSGVLSRHGTPGSHSITVIDRGLVPGGRAGLWETGGYRIDPGPVVLTMPEYLDDAFRAAGSSMDEHLKLHQLDPMYRGVFHDGSTLNVRPGRDAMTDEIRRVCGAKDAAQFGKFCDWLKKLYDAEQPNFIDRNFDSVLDLAKPLTPGLKLVGLGGFSRLHSLVAKHFDDERLHKMFSFQALYAGLAPKQALGAYAVITYMDSVLGVTFPEGGMHAVARGFAAASEAAGVQYRYDVNAERIVRSSGTNGAVRGVRLDDGEVIPADVVIVNADLPVGYRELLPELDAPRVARKGHYSPSCVLWLAGVTGELPPGTAHHNIHFGKEWHGSFDELLKQGQRMSDPSILMTVPTVTDPSLAPAGRHILYVLEPIPNLSGRINWDLERNRVKASLIARVRAMGFTGDVEVEKFIDPADWERMGMDHGTPFALSHRFFQTGPFRPNNVDKRVPGLVFTGSSTVPGVGVPMVVLSGKLAAARVAGLL